MTPAILLTGSVVTGALGGMGWSSLSLKVGWIVDPRLVMFLVFVGWNTWHFASQHFGVLSIYRRVSHRGAQRDRTMDRCFTVLLGCVLLPLAWYSRNATSRLGPVLDWVPPPSAHLLAAVVAVVAAGLTLAYIGRELLVDRRSIPRALYILSVGIQPICAVVAMSVYHFAVFTACHWMVALALSGRISSHLSSHGRVFPDLARFNRSFAAQVGVRILWSVPLYYLLFQPAAVFGAFDAGVHFGYRLGGTSVLLGALSGGYFGITFVHFLYDRRVYSFHDAQVRRAVGVPLFRERSRARRLAPQPPR